MKTMETREAPAEPVRPWRAVTVNGLAVRVAGRIVLVAEAHEDVTASAELVGRLPLPPGDQVVVATPSALRSGQVCPVLTTVLARTPRTGLGRRLRHVHRGRIWLAASRLGDPAGQNPHGPGWLARVLGRDVVAPTGPVSFVPGGGVFLEEEGSCWRVFGPDGAIVPLGRRFPVPDWETGLQGRLGPIRRAAAGVGLTVTEVPSGLLVRSAASSRGRGARLADAVPMTSDRFTLVVGMPDEAPVEADQLAAVIAAYPPSGHGRMMVLPWGPCPDEQPDREQRVADRTGRIIHSYSAMLVTEPDGTVNVVALDERGRPTWRPYARTLAWVPREIRAGPPIVLSAVLPVPGLRPQGAFGAWLDDDVVLDAVPAGLAVRRYPLDLPAMEAEGPALDPGRLLLQVGIAGRPVPADLWEYADRVVAEVPAEVRRWLWLMPMGPCDPASLAAANAIVVRRRVRLSVSDAPAEP